jgi:hypothetical protein
MPAGGKRERERKGDEFINPSNSVQELVNGITVLVGGE